MKKSKKLIGQLLCLLLCLTLIGGICVSGAEESQGKGMVTDEYVMQYLEISVPDTYIKLTSSLSDSDPAWLMANITDPSQIKSEFKDRNVVAAYFDPATNCTFYFVGKSTTETLKAFDITKYGDTEMVEYANTLFPQDNVIEFKLSAYKHPQMNMFRAEITEVGDNGDQELLYGTIVNGMLIQFSMNTTRIGAIRDDLLQELISNVKLTKIMTYEEYEASVKKTWTVIGCFFGGGILLMVILFIISKINQKKKKQRVAMISEELLKFRKKKQAGEASSELYYEIETSYDKKLIQSYSTFNTWFRNAKRDIVLAIIYLVVVGYAVYLGSKFVLIIGVAAAFILLYLKYSGCEKYVDNMIKRYDIKKKKSVTANYRFYDEYFTLSGIDSLSEYIYKQIFRVANYQGYMLLYISEDNALVIDVEKVPEDKRMDFVRHIMERAGL